MDAIDKEIKAKRESWAQNAEELKDRKVEAQRKKLVMRRDTFRAGTFVPDCKCDLCLRAVLTMDPSLVCENGKRLARWW